MDLASEHDQRPGDPGRNQSHYMRTLGWGGPQEIPMNWYDAYDNVKALGRWLVAERGFSGNELQGYYEKPWHWSDEWNEMQAEQQPKGTP